MNMQEMITKFMNKNKRQDIKELAEQKAEKVGEIYESSKEDDTKDEVQLATEVAVEEILKYPKQDLAVEMIGNINETVSPEVAVNAVIQLAEEKEFPEEAAIEVATNNDFSDEHIITIIEESSIGYEGKTAIAETLKDEKTRDEVQQQLDDEEEKKCLKQLHAIYLLCNEDINELKLKENLEKVLNNVHIHTSAIQDVINKIIGRLIAFNFARYGSNMVSKQTSLMPAIKMRENDIVKIASKEYRKIINEFKTVKGRPIREFNEQQLIDSISEEIEASAKTDGFNEENAFKYIRNLMNTFMRYDERKKFLISMQKEIENDRMRNTNKKIREYGIIEQLSELPEEEQEKVLKTLGKVLEDRKNKENRLKVAKTTPKIKSNEFTTQAKKSDEERE